MYRGRRRHLLRFINLCILTVQILKMLTVYGQHLIFYLSFFNCGNVFTKIDFYCIIYNVMYLENFSFSL